ncbi:hypothetical protein FIU94_20200 (plasmid) [Sulfitobacter sp. THAF37]|uniref:hypothetical protein n=1 Tax=Sulfitobacter sp. THAF37 TaxID=2587855 RepID=UPI001268E040|nr:hypothetical protein [Sulfitobacter sp. THAF37]QFT61164.1 hypothetical protein FIU94_20200 [Sulfitobacter sp. THAF37]
MLQKRLAGPGAATRKYDLITALGAHALSLDKHDQRLILRLITLLTARYNWGRDELCIGQREIAQLWSCNERTVKREMAKLRGLGWFRVKRQGARGRVTTYGLDADAMLTATRGIWPAIGSDFEVRLDAGSAAPEAEKVVPFPRADAATPPDMGAGDEWALAQAVLYQQDKGQFGAWLRALVRVGRAGGRLTLRAPSRFHAAYVQTHLSQTILTACQSVDDSVGSVEVIA